LEIGSIFLGYEGTYHNSTVSDKKFSATPADSGDQIDHEFHGVVSAPVWQSLVAQGYYRFRFTDFQDTNREDHLHSFGLGLHYFFNSHCSVRTFLSHDQRDSSTDNRDYETLTFGAGLNCTYSFQLGGDHGHSLTVTV
jgi:hypothetical protein